MIEQLGISAEDAAFLQQVLNEEVCSPVADPADSIDVTVVTSSPDTRVDNIVITEEMIADANSNSLMLKVPDESNDTTSRFSSAIWYDKIQEQTVIIAGLGGIGSYCSFLLGRMHPASVFLYDDDTVETVNLAGQLFRTDDVGKTKATAVYQSMRDYSQYGDVFAINSRFTSQSQPGNIMICGFDNMDARKTFYDSWKTHVKSFSDMGERAKCLFIDGRLAAESFQVFCIKGDDSYAMEQYENNWLFDDDEAEETICSYKQTSFCANMIASVMINCFVNFIANQCNPLIPRDVPFFTEYDASMMFFKTE